MSSILDLIQNRPSATDRIVSLLPLISDPGVGDLVNRGNDPGYNDLVNYSGDVPRGRSIFFNEQVDVLQPGDPRLVNVGGTQLARPAARSLRDILRDLGLQGTDVGGGYRDPQNQASLYAAKPGIAAPPGSSYHQEGLALDLAVALQNARFEQALAAAGWNQFSPSGEPWHWSYGVTG